MLIFLNIFEIETCKNKNKKIFIFEDIIVHVKKFKISWKQIWYPQKN